MFHFIIQNSLTNLNHQLQITNKPQHQLYKHKSLSSDDSLTNSQQDDYQKRSINNKANNLINRSSRHRKRQLYGQTHSRSLEHSSNYISKNPGEQTNESFDEHNNLAGDDTDDDKPVEFSSEIIEAADKVTYITNHMKSENDYEEVFYLYFLKHFIIFEIKKKII